MAEIYTIHLQHDSLYFLPREGGMPEAALSPTFNPKAEGDSITPVCRMGDPELAQCIVFRNKSGSGGIFSLHDSEGLLFCAVAENNLVFTIAQGYFGQLVANVRYGVDVFENMEIPDD